MDSAQHIRLKADDRSYFSLLKKEIHGMAAGAGFSRKKVGEIDIIVAEITSNLLKHAGGGEILVRLLHDETEQALELISIDNGVGMSVEKMEQDGVSTTQTLGQGLGSIKRLSDFSQVYSLKNWGTILLSRVYKNGRPEPAKRIAEIRSVIVAKPGEELCGDGFAFKQKHNRLQILLADGLGHGPEANLASETAKKSFVESLETNPLALLREMHVNVKKTRGLVGTIASFDIKTKKWSICGIGNIATRTQAGLTTKNYMAYNGIIGLHIPNTMKEQILDHERGQIIIMCSDGIKSRFDLQKYPGIFRYDLSILAAAIFKDHGRETDDMSIVVGRINMN